MHVRERVRVFAGEHIFGNFYVCYLWPWVGPPLAALRYDLWITTLHLLARNRRREKNV